MTLFVYFGCLSVVSSGTWLTSTGNSIGVARILPIAFAFGMAILILVYATAHLSGGHINPAVTLCLMILGKVSPVRGILYFVSQFGGSLLGAALVWASTTGLVGTDLFPEHPTFGRVGRPPFDLGATVLNPVLNSGNGFLLEFMGTFLLCLVVVQTAIDSHSPARPHLTPLAIGFAVLVAHICLIPLTGCGINPARTFGPAIVTCIGAPDRCGSVIQSSWWIYYVGPFSASFVAAFVTNFVHGGPQRYQPLASVSDRDTCEDQSNDAQPLPNISPGIVDPD